MKKSPLAIVKDRFSDKASLVKAVEALATDELFARKGGAAGEKGKSLKNVSNQKLIHLHDVLTEVKKSFGSRTSLIDAILKNEKRSKDTGFRTRLEKWSTPRLFDALKASKRRASA